MDRQPGHLQRENLLAGLTVTVIGSLIVAFLIGQGRWAPLSPVSTPERPIATTSVVRQPTPTYFVLLPTPQVQAVTVKIAIIAPVSGSNATSGDSIVKGAELAIEEWNAEGGVVGQQITDVVADGRCDAQEARNAANKVITQDNVKFIIGEACSSASIPVSEVANANKVIQVSPTSTNAAVTVDDKGNTRPYTFRACFIDDFQGVVMANFASNNLRAKTAAVIMDQDNAYSVGLAQAFITQFKENGGQVVVRETYTSNDTDFSAILSKIAAAKPDFFFVPDYYQKVNLIGKQAKKKSITAIMGGGDGWDSDQLDTAALDGGYYSNHYDPSAPHPTIQDWLERYAAAYDGGIPNALATLSYDSANMILSAIKDANSTDTDRVRTALEQFSFDGVTGKISFDGKHDPIKSAVVISVKNGKKTYAATVVP